MWKYELGQMFLDHDDLYIDNNGKSLPLKIPSVSNGFLNAIRNAIKDIIKYEIKRIDIYYIDDLYFSILNDNILLNDNVFNMSFRSKNRRELIHLNNVPLKDLKRLPGILLKIIKGDV